MIVSIGNEATADLFHGRETNRLRRLPHTIRQRALNRLDILNAANHREIILNRCKVIGKVFTAFLLIGSGALCLSEKMGGAHNVELIDYQ